MDDFKDSTTSLVAYVDCTAGGKDLCDKNGVRGYPTIKYGDPGDLKDYNGGRTYDDLKKFADENLPIMWPRKHRLVRRRIQGVDRKIPGYGLRNACKSNGRGSS